jgi:ferric-dicitrate binding protein FerR (iron transport regulator)
MKPSLNRLIQDVRRYWGKDEALAVDWDAVEKRLFARIEAEHRMERWSLASLAPPRNVRVKLVGAALASAAAIAAVVGLTRQPYSLDPDRATPQEEAASLIAIEGDGEVLVDGRPAAVGATLRLGDVIEARGAQVTVSRPGKLTCAIERGSSVKVTHAQGALVLALTTGGLEAQVVPVSSGEALAVDVGPSRVAVHGTHLRVARVGEHVVVDLTEGVVSVGAAPRVGSTLGVLVSAPAHAEFSAADAQGTIHVTHTPSAVRAAAVLSPAAQPKPMAAVVPPSPTALSRPETRETAATPSAPAVRVEPRPVGPSFGTTPPDPNAQSIVAAAVRACMAERLHADDVTVVVSTTLYVQLRDDGWVHSARFDPPVAPDVNACAAQSIYKTRFNHGGELAIAVSVKN